MSCGGAGNVEISPVNALWRIEAQEQLDFAGLTGADVKGNAFNISTAKDAILHYVWGDDGVAADPAIVGRVGVDFAVTGDAMTASAIATAVAAALDALPGYVATASDTKVTVKRVAVGKVTAAADVDMGVVVTICFEGKDVDLGLLSGDVELSLAPSVFTIQAHQNGLTPLGALMQGIETAEVGLELLETKTSNLKAIYGVYGTEGFTPSMGTEVFGIGTSKQGENLLPYCARLELKPVNAVDDSKNVCLMLTLPIPDSLVFSGENPRTLSVTFQGYVADGVDSRVNTVLFGNPSQTGI